ncbi:polyketide synthase [Streptomyces formicae]|uniref:Polyketide synthase n=1 Tax=Streptomyces formicae TaxID=1616117 RepID=A0ABY3WQ69_9ACTN|nr:polyketide synthase [Streptomyces formicae]
MKNSNTPAPEVAVIGMSCRAAGVETPLELWETVDGGIARFCRVPEGRWPGWDPGSSAAAPPRAAFIKGIEEFDARFFGISPRMAAWMDPQHRMLLELAWQAVENAALNPDDLAGSPVAVFVGACMSDYRERMNSASRVDSAAFSGTLMAFSANRVSYQFDWTGPSTIIDSACSSGLTALGLAVRGLQAGEYPMALVGAPNLFSHGFYASTAFRGGALSPTGDSTPFRASRDGYVRGEGGVCVLLKLLSAARSDGDPIHAVIRGVGLSHNGLGGGLTGTDAPSQTRLIMATAEAAGRRVQDIGYLEAHGTGTGGDAIEVEALADAISLSEGARPAGPEGKVWIGSVKANIGHLEGAAGLIGLVKAVLVLQRGVIPKIAGLDRPDPALPGADASVAVATRPVAWPAGPRPRLAAVNSFGLGGALAHALVEEVPEISTQDRIEELPLAFPLSAMTESALTQVAARLLRELSGGLPTSLASIAWTLQNGRRALPIRKVVLASDLYALRTALTAVASSEHHPNVLDPEAGSFAEEPVGPWLRGEPVDWSRYSPSQPQLRRAALPGYPFERRPYWFDAEIPQSPNY